MKRPSHPTDGEDKYLLQGWNNDAQENEGGHNLLKILEKKITFPLLQGTFSCHHQTQNKEESFRKILKQQTKGTFRENHTKSQIDGLRKEHKQSNNPSYFSIKRNKTEKIKPSICVEEKTKTKQNQQNSKKPAFPNNHSCLDFFQEQSKFQKQKGKEILAKKNNKMISLTSLPTKQKLSILKERVTKIPHLQSNNQNRKSIQNPRKAKENLKITDSKFIFIKNWESKTKHLLIRERQSSLKVKKKKPVVDLELKRAYIMMQKTNIWNNNIVKTKILKTEVNDFMDEHLQSHVVKNNH